MSLEDEKLSLDAERRQLSVADPSYASKLQDFMEEYNTKYTERVEDDLFPAYDDYFGGIEAYLTLINAFAAECQDPRHHVTAIVADNLQQLEEAVVALNKVVSTLSRVASNSISG